MPAEFAPPIPLDDALAIVDAMVQVVGGDERLAVGQALGRCLAAPVIAPRALPPFDNSAVDGYAFRLDRIPRRQHGGSRYVDDGPRGVCRRSTLWWDDVAWGSDSDFDRCGIAGRCRYRSNAGRL
jgi:hypothetical protein